MIRKIQRVAILYSRLSGYLLSCLRTLKSCFNIELLVFSWAPTEDAPFDRSQFQCIDHLYLKTSYPTKNIIEILETFCPDAIYIAGWRDKDYLKVANFFKKQGIPIICGLDNQWEGSWRQKIGSILAPLYLHPSIDVLWVAGERQASFAKRLGYSGRKIWYGLYCCDWEKFASVRLLENHKIDKFFLFVGRYVYDKGLQDLIKAYRDYRSHTENPWKLYCVGSGELKPLLNNLEGVSDLGFIQPDDLPVVMHQASAFILPSRKENWGVVIQEAAASSLPLICSDACGATVHLLQHEYNGFLFEPNNVDQLTYCLIKMSQMSDSNRVKMGERSHALSKQFTPQRWANTFLEGL
jgi:glycosyltransferase involved in cell wall biosynthesis